MIDMSTAVRLAFDDTASAPYVHFARPWAFLESAKEAASCDKIAAWYFGVDYLFAANEFTN